MLDRLKKPCSLLSRRQQLATIPSVVARSISARLIGMFSHLPGNSFEEFVGIQADLELGNDLRVVADNEREIDIKYSGHDLSRIIRLRRETTDIRVLLQVFASHEYRHLETLVRQFMDPDDVRHIVDAGANIGLTTLYLSSLFKNARFVCVEPDDGNFEILSHNVRQNGLSDVGLFKGGVWSESKSVSLSHGFRDGREWAITLVDQDGEETPHSSFGEDSASVEVLSINDLMGRFDFPSIDVLKLDIEGGEFAVFNSSMAAESVLAKTSFIAIEIHDESGPRSQIESYLNENGFLYYTVSETTFGVNLRRFDAFNSR
jgi:FkbM family methyltransferase